MNEQQHTPTPWRVSGNGTMRFIDASVGNGIAQEVATCMRVEHGDMEANVRRIVACVNACEGLATEYLETVGLPEFAGKTLCADLAQQELQRVTAQSDQLLAALEKLACMRLNMIADGVVDRAIAAVKGDK